MPSFPAAAGTPPPTAHDHSELRHCRLPSTGLRCQPEISTKLEKRLISASKRAENKTRTLLHLKQRRRAMSDKKKALKDGGFVKKDDTWYHRIGVAGENKTRRGRRRGVHLPRRRLVQMRQPDCNLALRT